MIERRNVSLDNLGIGSSRILLRRRRRGGGVDSSRISQLKTPKILYIIFEIGSLTTTIQAVLVELRNWFGLHAVQVWRRMKKEIIMRKER